jgi:hypothetical protein
MSRRIVSSALLVIRVPCETCRVSAERFRYGPCEMCVEARLVDVQVGECVCDHCGRKLTRFVRMRWNDRDVQVGTTCALRVMELGGVQV